MSLLSDETTVERLESGRFRGMVTGSWSVAGNPNGGYLMALMTRAVLTMSDRSATPIVTANFLSRTAPGPVEIFVEEITRSGQFQRFQVKLVQEGKERVRAFATFAADKSDVPPPRYEAEPTPLAARGDCVPVPAVPTYTLFENVEHLLDPSSAGWLHGKLVDRSEIKGWLRLRDAAAHDLGSLLLMADAMPPAIFVSQGMVAWVPTIELSVNVRQLPVSPWLNCALRTRFVTAGMLEADGEIWDEAGNLIAISRQIAQVRRS